MNRAASTTKRGGEPASAGIRVSAAIHSGVLTCGASVRDRAVQTAGATAATVALTIGPADTVQRAAQLMTEHGTTHLVVVDAGRRPVGILSTLDVAAALGER
jgi:CBS-domain-containing membrane protein